ncbi:hypothetical protein [Pseudoalteromonas phenolica]|uniref:hypothetical protein n=1 Tax=Pseudoalteromonas phenolica TaxID=161398 RepID=UPI00110B592E|nr:hypothetical protein [Pseudoalteromonas phenolica]TMO55768.1 hypothetical protein CWC21_10000 [Pseudoalteromonas phenolica]
MLRAFCSCLLLLSCYSYSAEKISFSGFGTVGVVHSNSDTYKFRTDISKYNDKFEDNFDFNSISSLGFQTDISLNANFDFVGQVVYRGQDNISLDNTLSLAFLRYKPSPNWDFRAGRTLLDLYLLTEYRDISFAYPWAKVPNEVYSLLPFRSFDGADVSYINSFGSLDYRIKLFAGESIGEVALDDQTVNLEIFNGLGASLELSQFDWTFSIKHTRAKTRDNIAGMQEVINGLELIPEQLWPDKNKFLGEFSLVNKQTYFTSAGLRYNFDEFTILAEIVRLKSDSSVVSAVKSGYVNTTYNYDKGQFFYTYAIAKSKSNEINEAVQLNGNLPEQVERLFLAVNESFGVFSPNQQTHSVGARYDIKDNVAFKLQFDHTSIDAQGGALWSYQGMNTLAPKESFTTVFLSVSFTF